MPGSSTSCARAVSRTNGVLAIAASARMRASISTPVRRGIVQSASWTLHEKVAFDRARIRSFDWSTYPILRFDGVPESIEVHIIDRPGEPYLGTGEAAQGPAAAAIGNAVAHATGRRLRDLPLALGR